MSDDLSVERDPGHHTEQLPLERIAAAVILGLLLSVLAASTLALLLATSKGLDLTDEGLYLLNALAPDDYVENFTKSHLIWSPLLDLTGSVTGLRVLRLAALLGAGAALGRSVALRARDAGRYGAVRAATLTAAVATAALAPTSWLPQSPGYNDLTVIAVLGICAVVVRLRRDLEPRSAVQLAAAFAGLWWLLLLAKWPSAIALGGLCTLVALPTLRRLSGREALRVVAAAAGALLACVVITQLWLEPIPDIVSGLRAGASSVSGTHGTSALLEGYAHDVVDLLRTVGRRWWLLLLGCGIGALVARPHLRRLGEALFVAAIVAVLAVSAVQGSFDGGVRVAWAFGQILPTVLVFAACVLGVAALSCAEVRRRLGGVPWLAVALVAVAPLVGALGSNNPLWYGAGSLSACWVAALLLVLVPVFGPSIAVDATALVLSVAVAAAAVAGTWLHPYRQVPLREVDTRISAGPAEGLTVDRPTAELITAVQSLAGDGASVVTVWKRPGLAFAAGAAQPVNGWLSSTFPARAVASLQEACLRPGTVVLLHETPEPPPEIRVALDEGPCATRDFRPADAIEAPDGQWLRVLVADPAG